MAEALAVVAAKVVLREALSLSLKGIKLAIKKTWYFKSKLKEMEGIVERTNLALDDMEQLYEDLGKRKEVIDRLTDLLKQGDELVQKCEKIRFKCWEKLYYDTKLDEFNKSLHNFVAIELQVQNTRDTMETLKEVRGLAKRLEKGGSSGWSSGVPLTEGVVIGFDDRIRDVKTMLLDDSGGDDCSIVVVSGVGGCGKSTLVKKLCRDPEIQEKFGTNIYYATILEKYDIKVIIKDLLDRDRLVKLRDFDNDQVAIQQWGSFLGENQSEILLVLDDVWSDSIIMDLKFKSPTYKVLVTSRAISNQFKTYPLEPLEVEDATLLFRHWAFSDHGTKHSTNMPDEREKHVPELVKCCMNHPLVLSVIGGLLNGARVAAWELMLKALSEEKQSPLHLDESIERCLKKSLVFFEKEPELKQYYQDLGLFPKGQKMGATLLLDIWGHLYKHDEEGLATIHTLTKLSSKNLATLLPIRKHISCIANHCEEEYVRQHDMMRDLAIDLSSQESIEHRERLIISPYGKEYIQLPQITNARILSISSDETFNSIWNEFQVPKVEVLVLNFMSKMHPMPQFMQKMEGLKVLMITNYGSHLSEIQNFPAPQCLSNLTRMRLEHVQISSVSVTLLQLEKLQRLSLIMCKIGNTFNQGTSIKLTNLFEIHMDSCDDLVTFPLTLCSLTVLKKLSISNCHELTLLPDEFGQLSNLEVLRLASCSKLKKLPESMQNLRKLRIMDLSNCLSLRELPLGIGELGSLKTIDARGCPALPKSVKEFDSTEVFCDDETCHIWNNLENVEVKVVEEDRLYTLYKIIQV